MWDLQWAKQHWSRFSPSTSVSPAKHSIKCSTLIIVHHKGWYNRPVVASVIVDSVAVHLKKGGETKEVLDRTGPILSTHICPSSCITTSTTNWPWY
jgi:hypothetical protein